MARTREIKPAFFKNEELAECSAEARLLFIGLWTLADRHGRLEFRPKRIRAELFPYESPEITRLAGELHGKKFIVLYEVDGKQYCAIPGFTKHQRPHPKEAASTCPKPPTEKGSCDKAVELNGEPETNPASCAFPSSNPLILQSSNPSILQSPTESCSETPPASSPPPLPSVPAVMEFPVDGKGTKSWSLTQDKLAEYQESFPNVDVLRECTHARQWLRDNPTKRKTASGMLAFLTRWLTKATNVGGSPRAGPQGPSAPRKTAEEIMAEIPPDYFAHQTDHR